MHQKLTFWNFIDIIVGGALRRPLILRPSARLASRALRGEPVFPYLSALRAAESIGKIPESLIMVPGMGLEPIRSIQPQDFKSCAYTSSAIPAIKKYFTTKILSILNTIY